MINNYTSTTTIANDETQKLQILISARGLYDMDFFSKSDPYVKVFFKKAPNQPFLFIGKTETIDNNLNPNFKKSFLVDYIFETQQSIRFEVMDEDDKTNDQNDDFIGKVQTTLGALAGAKDQTSILSLLNPQKQNNVGKLVIRVQPANNANQVIKMKWKAHHLLNTDSWFDWWDRSDPYLRFLKVRNDNTYVEAGRTEVINNELNPNWKSINVPFGKLIREDNLEQKFKIECWDWEEAGQAKHQFIGQTYFKLPELLQKQKPYEIVLTNEKQKKPGFLVCEAIQIFENPTFLDYLRGGLQLNLSVAIDFTGSNGVPTSPSSLHYMNLNGLNQYQKTILAISNILLNYDSDKKIPAFGFGAKTKFSTMHNSNLVNHCFPLSGNPNQIEANGLQGLMGMYANALTHVELSGPTYFAPLLRQFFNLAQESQLQGSFVYQILLILTDGQIHDMNATVDLIVANSSLPLSIIIVGIGNANFENMNTLDGDNGLENSSGTKASRDIVQFVPFSQVQMNPDLLAQELLAELPTQVVQYMNLMGKVPNKPVGLNIENILLQNENVESIEADLKKNITNLFVGLTVNAPSQ